MTRLYKAGNFLLIKLSKLKIFKTNYNFRPLISLNRTVLIEESESQNAQTPMINVNRSRSSKSLITLSGSVNSSLADSNTNRRPVDPNAEIEIDHNVVDVIPVPPHLLQGAVDIDSKLVVAENLKCFKPEAKTKLLMSM